MRPLEIIPTLPLWALVSIMALGRIVAVIRSYCLLALCFLYTISHAILHWRPRSVDIITRQHNYEDNNHNAM